MDVSWISKEGGVLGGIFQAFNHDVGRFDEGCGAVTLFQLQLTHCIRRDDGGHGLIARFENDLGEQAFDTDADHFACDLVPSADSTEALA